MESLVIRDTLLLVLLVFGLGTALHAWLRHRNPLSDWNRRGNVWTAPFGIGDLLAIGALLATLAFLAGRPSAPADPTPEIGVGNVLAGGLFLLGLAGIVGFVLHWRRHDLVEVFGLDRLRPGALVLHAVIWTAIGIGLVYLTHSLWMPLLEKLELPDLDEQGMVRLLRESGDAGLRIAIALTAVVIAPVAEEVLFRGYLYGAVKAHSDSLLAAFVSAGVFAAIHFNVAGLAPLFVLGLLLAAAYEWTGSLWLPIAIHAIFNATTVVYQSLATP